jgi:hypothetical protein
VNNEHFNVSWKNLMQLISKKNITVPFSKRHEKDHSVSNRNQLPATTTGRDCDSDRDRNNRKSWRSRRGLVVLIHESILGIGLEVCFTNESLYSGSSYWCGLPNEY